MKTEAEQRTSDLEYIKENIGIDPATTSQDKAKAILRKHEINTTSWVLSRLESEYGGKFGESYRKSISKKTCMHGFIGACPYCKYGTE